MNSSVWVVWAAQAVRKKSGFEVFWATFSTKRNQKLRQMLCGSHIKIWNLALWPFEENFISWLVTHVNARDFTVITTVKNPT